MQESPSLFKYVYPSINYFWPILLAQWSVHNSNDHYACYSCSAFMACLDAVIIFDSMHTYEMCKAVFDNSIYGSAASLNVSVFNMARQLTSVESTFNFSRHSALSLLIYRPIVSLYWAFTSYYSTIPIINHCTVIIKDVIISLAMSWMYPLYVHRSKRETPSWSCFVKYRYACMETHTPPHLHQKHLHSHTQSLYNDTLLCVLQSLRERGVCLYFSQWSSPEFKTDAVY